MGSSVSVKISIKTTHKFDFYTFSTAVPAISCSTYFPPIITVCWLSESEYSFDGTAKTQCLVVQLLSHLLRILAADILNARMMIRWANNSMYKYKYKRDMPSEMKGRGEAGKGEKKWWSLMRKFRKFILSYTAFPTLPLSCCVVLFSDVICHRDEFIFLFALLLSLHFAFIRL